MLLGFVVLIEVDAGSVVLLHGITGQQLSDEQSTNTHRSIVQIFLDAGFTQ